MKKCSVSADWDIARPELRSCSSCRARTRGLWTSTLQRFDKATAVSLGFPHEIMALEPVKAMIYGGLRNRIKT
jgi:hypothetical protein